MSEAVIVSTARSPIGRAFKGSLKDIRPDDLAAAVVTAALAKIPGLDPKLIDDLYLGCAEPSGEQGANMARVVAILAGFDHLPGATVNRFCASSVQTTRMAFHAIKAGEGEIFISGGVECVSRYKDFAGPGGTMSENQNPKFAKTQARNAQMAADNSTWTDPRSLGLMPDVYLAMGQTAGNCCPLNDGAAAVVVMSDAMARQLGLTPLARVVSTGLTALSPEIMGLGPVEASRQALARAGMSMKDMDLVEINEAFAVQVLASMDDLGIDPDKLNVHGGAIALGHPFGSTGARITTTLLNGLTTRDGQFGLETMCIGGGQGMAIIYERLS